MITPEDFDFDPEPAITKPLTECEIPEGIPEEPDPGRRMRVAYQPRYPYKTLYYYRLRLPKTGTERQCADHGHFYSGKMEGGRAVLVPDKEGSVRILKNSEIRGLSKLYLYRVLLPAEWYGMIHRGQEVAVGFHQSCIVLWFLGRGGGRPAADSFGAAPYGEKAPRECVS